MAITWTTARSRHGDARRTSRTKFRQWRRTTLVQDAARQDHPYSGDNLMHVNTKRASVLPACPRCRVAITRRRLSRGLTTIFVDLISGTVHAKFPHWTETASCRPHWAWIRADPRADLTTRPLFPTERYTGPTRSTQSAGIGQSGYGRVTHVLRLANDPTRSTSDDGGPVGEVQGVRLGSLLWCWRSKTWPSSRRSARKRYGIARSTTRHRRCSRITGRTCRTIATSQRLIGRRSSRSTFSRAAILPTVLTRREAEGH